MCALSFSDSCSGLLKVESPLLLTFPLPQPIALKVALALSTWSLSAVHHCVGSRRFCTCNVLTAMHSKELHLNNVPRLESIQSCYTKQVHFAVIRLPQGVQDISESNAQRHIPGEQNPVCHIQAKLGPGGRIHTRDKLQSRCPIFLQIPGSLLELSLLFVARREASYIMS